MQREMRHVVGNEGLEVSPMPTEVSGRGIVVVRRRRHRAIPGMEPLMAARRGPKFLPPRRVKQASRKV